MPHISTLDEVSRATLERILATDVRGYTAEDVAFLKARRDYLTGEERHNLEPILNGEDPQAQDGPPSEPIEKPTHAPARRGPRKAEAAE